MRESTRAGFRFAGAQLLFGLALGVRNAVLVAYEEAERGVMRFGRARDAAREREDRPLRGSDSCTIDVRAPMTDEQRALSVQRAIWDAFDAWEFANLDDEGAP